ncbi:hypothetical protein MGG_09543 [Pyricularia oryzae 70-15]|uniref:Uncharacterized protein n=3 Tax=Pyricularia oryzae TaxID=318829 RepID=G4N1C0_PYRO7|nr:uncharacterized protein MGG_09543 [Pyricularia oryzae 70-15]EHA52391.1 hypothetical protein MGG_09543 [Pyricularia oryzae 70-15]
MHLPIELITMIVNEIDLINDLSSFSKVNRVFLELYQFNVFASAVSWKVVWGDITQVMLDLFYHGVRHDSVRIVSILTHHIHEIVSDMKIKGYIPMEPFKSKRITYFHHALVADAPKVSAYLAADDDMFDESFEYYPSMVAIYQALFPQTMAAQWELNKALRVACNYGLSRTTYVLLNRGADPMDMSPFGLMPIHLALANRQPWWDSDKYKHQYKGGFEVGPNVHHLDAEQLAQCSISALIKYGCPVDLASAQMRRHKCDHKCLGSPDCDHQNQTPLHIAAKIDFGEVADFLLKKGANPYTPNGEGYTPLYCAIVQEGSKAAGVIFKSCHPVVNPVVHIPTGTTALHIACRFALPAMVDRLLEAGADPDVINSHGLTPLHEVLSQTQPDRSRQVYLVLKSLARFNADPATPSSAPKTPWDMAKNHPFPDVQEMFADHTLMTFWELDQLIGGNSSPHRKGRRQTKRGSQAIKRTDKQAPSHTIAPSSPIEAQYKVQSTQSDSRSGWGGWWGDAKNPWNGKGPWDEEPRPEDDAWDEPSPSTGMKPGVTETLTQENFLDFGEDLILFDITTPMKPSPAASLQTQIASAGWRPKLLTLNNKPAKPKPNASPFSEMESRDAAKKAASEYAPSASSQGTKKGQSKKKWAPLKL